MVLVSVGVLGSDIWCMIWVVVSMEGEGVGGMGSVRGVEV